MRVYLFSEHMNHLQIIHGDVMKVQLPFFDVCVANLPYQVRPTMFCCTRLAGYGADVRTRRSVCPARSRRRSSSSCWRTGPCSAVQ